MKNLYLFALILAFPFLLPAQNIHGLWSGTLVNDSTQRTQNFELGLSEYRGKITGYTYTTFIDNDTFYYSIKRIRAERKGGNLVIEDVEMVGNNFPERKAKHVKQTTTFPLLTDTTIDISQGRWSTNQTKKFYSIGGSAKLREQEDEQGSDLLVHLQEANVKTDIVVNQKEKNREETIAKNYSTVMQQQKGSETLSENKIKDVVRNSNVKSPEIKKVTEINSVQETTETKGSTSGYSTANIVSNNSPEIKETRPKNVSIKQEPVTYANQVQPDVVFLSNKSSEIKNKPTGQTGAAEQKKEIIKPVIQETNKPFIKPEQKNAINETPANRPDVQNKEVIEVAKELPSVVAGRKNQTVQDIYFKNDSLILSLYDNGIVDGDTVSVFVNGETIISKQMLKEAAIKKIIYISDKSDSVELVLFAENLGTIPPNTGLLTVRDGDNVYQVRFSADLQKNASIILRRRKEQ